jgi:hypothetical protein
MIVRLSRARLRRDREDGAFEFLRQGRSEDLTTLGLGARTES